MSCGRFKISEIVRDERIGLAVDRGFQDEFVLCIRELRTPAEVHVHRFRGAGECREKSIHIFLAHARREPGFGTLHDLLVLQQQGGADQWSQPAACDVFDDCVACAGSTTQGGDDHRCV